MPRDVKFHPLVVSDDLPRLDARIRTQVFSAIEARLVSGSPLHGKPLQKSLKGCRRLRVGDFRIVYTIGPGDSILIVAIRHRSGVYKFAEKRRSR